MIYQASNTDDQRPAVLEYLDRMNFNRVIDIGGVMYPWARKYVTMYADILSPHEYLPQYEDLYDDHIKNCHFIVGDINANKIWDELNGDVAKHGLYDFAICTHTLEDIRNPFLALECMPKIAKAGFIAVPCKHVELCKGVECPPRDWEDWGINGQFRGFMHHRWIFTVKNDELVGFPKLNFLDVMTGLEWATIENKRKYHHELSLWWQGDIPYSIMNDDYLGPNGPTVCQIYREGLIRGL